MDIKSINRFAFHNDYSFDWNGMTVSPFSGSYDNGYVLTKVPQK